MSDTTTHLGLPYLLAAQAQKHVTHNEALRLLVLLEGVGEVAPGLFEGKVAGGGGQGAGRAEGGEKEADGFHGRAIVPDRAAGCAGAGETGPGGFPGSLSRLPGHGRAGLR